MKAVMMTGPTSNSGKTTVTLGIIRALKNRGINLSPFKTGPDFIDTKYLGRAAKGFSGNLDMHLMGEKGLGDALAMNIGDLAILEGAMGYFDGIHNTYKNSSYDMARKLDIPAVLVYSPKGEMFSVIPKIKGMVDFQDSKIKGIILNKVSQPMYLLLKEQIEKHIDVKVLGYLALDKKMEVEEGILGWDLSKGEDFLDYLGQKVEETIDLDSLLSLSNDLDLSPYEYPKERKIKVAIAYDDAFNFYYRENLNLFENICQVEYFSPLRDKKVPKADLIYIGGGYPELYREQLSMNREIIEDLKALAENNQYIIGESGGFIYLVDSIEGSSMAGILQGSARTTERLERFGYVDIELEEDCILGRKGDLLRGQEFHKTKIETELKEIFNIGKPMGKRKWRCGYKYKNVLGYFQHINFLGNMDSFNYILDRLEKHKGEMGCI